MLTLRHVPAGTPVLSGELVAAGCRPRRRSDLPRLENLFLKKKTIHFLEMRVEKKSKLTVHDEGLASVEGGSAALDGEQAVVDGDGVGVACGRCRRQVVPPDKDCPRGKG